MKFYSLLLCCAICCWLAACGGNDDKPGQRARPDFVYAAPTEAQLQAVKEDWNSRDLSPRDVSLLLTDHSNATFEVRLYQHSVGSNVHYGLVTVPTATREGGYPVVLYADGLDQSNPVIDLAFWVQLASARLDQAVFIFPLFRGRTLVYKGTSLNATGDFCDAYDGATDDSIALLNLVESEVPAANFDRLMVRGGSRGGNVALLLGIRDPRVTVVAAASAPTDFYRETVRINYGDQYHCQFFAGKTSEQARLRMLASSPLHFTLAPGVNQVWLDHGTADEVVPLWNATEMAARLKTQPLLSDLMTYSGASHNLSQAPGFGERQHMIYEMFLH